MEPVWISLGEFTGMAPAMMADEIIPAKDAPATKFERSLTRWDRCLSGFRVRSRIRKIL